MSKAFFLAWMGLMAAVAAVGCGPTSETLSTSAPGSLSATDPNTAVIWINGMGCPQCANNVDQQLLKVSGVESVAIDLGKGTATAKLSASAPPTRQQLADAVDRTGFTLVRIQMP